MSLSLKLILILPGFHSCFQVNYQANWWKLWMKTELTMWNWLWCSTVPLSVLCWLQTTRCNRQEWRCSMSQCQNHFCMLITFLMHSAESRWRQFSCKETKLLLFRTNSQGRKTYFSDMVKQIHTERRGASSMKWTTLYGILGVQKQESTQLRRLWQHESKSRK